MVSRKVAETPFPMPFAQVIEWLVTIFSLSVPLLFSSWLSSTYAVGIFSFVTSWVYLAMNEVSRMLEEPFGGDSNDLPLCLLHWEFNNRIVQGRYARGWKWDGGKGG